MKYLYLLISMLLIGILMSGCSSEYSQANDLFMAEKMLYKAEKLKQEILSNLEVATPQQYQQTENAYREIINTFGKRQKLTKEIQGILRRSWLTVAELYLARKKNDRAIKIYQEIIKSSPEDRELCGAAQFLIGRSYEQMNKLNEAIRAYQYVFKNYPPVLGDTLLPNFNILQTPIYVARLYLRQGNRNMANQQYELARSYFNGVIKKWQNTEIAMAAEYQIALSYSDQRMWEKSIAILNNIVGKYRGKKQIPEIMYNLGQLYQQQLNRPRQAIQVFQQIIQNYPQGKNLGKVHLAIGAIYLQQKKYDIARQQFKQVLNNYSRDRTSCLAAQIAIAKSYELQNNWSKALNEYQWVINNYPQSAQALMMPMYIAEHYEKNRQNDLAKKAYEDAINRYQQIVNKYPATPLKALALDYTGASYMKLEKWSEAAKALEALLEMELPPRQGIATYLKLENIYEEKLNDVEKALEIYGKVLKKYPKISDASLIQNKAQQLRQKLELYRQTNKPPRAVDFVAANLLSTSSLALKWRSNHEPDFDHYQLVRSESPGVDLSDKTIAQISQQGQVEFVDNDVEAGKTYYYRLFTFDKGNLHTGGKEISVTVAAKKIAESVSLTARADSWSTISLSWNQYRAKDFDSYKIYRSTTPGVGLTSNLVKSIFEQRVTQLKDRNLKENTTYYYKIYVYNTDGASKPSQEIQVTTPANTPPNAVKLFKPVRTNQNVVTLSWSTSLDNDFASYRIYRSEKSPVSIDQAPIWINSNKKVTRFKDTGVSAGKVYHYKVVVFDKGGLFAESNEVSIIP